MPDQDDFELLADYSGRGSEEAFTALADRYVHVVYSAALRQVGSAELAEEVTQAVFIILSQKAHTFCKGTVLSGWLLRTTRFTSTNLLVSQYRRLRREQQAAEMQNTSSDESAWEEMAPILDEALAQLCEKDRNALALRFFSQKSLKEVGVALGIDADTAGKRVSRAVAKLRRIFAKRGVVLPAVTIVSLLSAYAVQAAPAGIISAIAAAALLKGGGSSSGAASLLIKSTLKVMAWTKLKTTVVTTSAILLAIGAVTLLTISATGSFNQPGQIIPVGRLKLPVGLGTPAIGLNGAHGIILASDGSLWSWGENDNGWPVLGLGNMKTQLCLRRIGDETNWTSIAVGEQHSLALKSDGTLWGWGQNLYGQLAVSASGRANHQRSTPVPSAPGNDWKQAAVGGSHSVALKKDGTLWAWGNNWAGQLGVGRTNHSFPEAMQIGSATNWVKVWAGILETVALQSDGSLWFWGDNPNPAVPQTGPGANNIFSPTRIAADTNWVDVGFGPWTVLAIKSNGTLWAWGRCAHEFTGVRDHTLDVTPVRVGTDSDWKAISSFGGWNYEVLMKKDGSLWGLQAPSLAPVSAPKPLRVTRLDLQKDFVAFAGAGRIPIGAVLTRDGEVWTWGKVLGQHTPERKSLQQLAKLARRVHLNVDWGESKFVMRDKPWRLPNLDHDVP